MRGVVAAKTYAHSELLWTEESIRRAIEDALTSEEAYLALKFMCLLLSSRFDELPELKAWHVRMLAGPESRPKRVGPKPHLNDQRDLLITREVEQLRVVGFRPTRNAQPSATRVRPRRLSGCEVVQMALSSLGLEMSYKAIEVVWTKNRRKIRSS